MKVFLSDAQQAPSGWVPVRWPQEAITLLDTRSVEAIRVEYDLGDDSRGTGYAVLLWIERAVITRGFRPPHVIEVDAVNAVARQRMMASVETIRRLAESRALLDDQVSTRPRLGGTGRRRARPQRAHEG
jgi:hypothetical protein